MMKYTLFKMSFDYLMQAVKTLYESNHDEKDLNITYEYVLLVEDETLKMYKERNSILSFDNDLELFMELTKKLISVYENMEEYEKCLKLNNKLKHCSELIK